MTGYTRTELEALTREARLLNLARGAACPLASALARSLSQAGAGNAPCPPSAWWDLLGAAWATCHDAIDRGWDLEFDGIEDAWDVAQILRFVEEAAGR